MGVGGRQGLGKLRHLECHSLWVQQRLRRKEFTLRKVASKCNPADIYTKHLESRGKLDQLVELFGCDFREGRPGAAPALRRDNHHAIRSLDAQDLDRQEPYDPCVLPHMHLPDDIEKLFPMSVPELPRRGEDDALPGEELRDPVPGIERQLARAKAAWTTRRRATFPRIHRLYTTTD